MYIHFATRAAAATHLTENGWRQIRNGNWVSRDGVCAASIHPKFDEVVVVHFWEVALAA
jgi:hypothetical protein